MDMVGIDHWRKKRLWTAKLWNRKFECIVHGCLHGEDAWWDTVDSRTEGGWQLLMVPGHQGFVYWTEWRATLHIYIYIYIIIFYY